MNLIEVEKQAHQFVNENKEYGFEQKKRIKMFISHILEQQKQEPQDQIDMSSCSI